MSTSENVKALIALVEQGKFLEAIEQFYAPDATMQENLGPLRVGLPVLLENERQVLARTPGIRLERVGSVVVDGDTAAINWVFLLTYAEGRTMRLDEVACQEWQDGKIVRERFYYDPSQLQARAE
jgi:ketosteroid isomerase-like protein